MLLTCICNDCFFCREKLQTQEASFSKTQNESRTRIQELEGSLAGSRSNIERLEAAQGELQREFDQFVSVLTINPDHLQLTDEKIGAGAYAGIVLTANDETSTSCICY